jgi:leucyl/phenylalanyl-tRNA--protein transferase
MFPDPESATPEGIIAIGGDLSVERLRAAYTVGIFPWPQRGFPLLWFSPPQRGILRFKNFKVPKSTQRKIRQKAFKVTLNQAFDEVIENCAKVPRTSDSATWILPEMIEAYKELHRQGYALSFEAWQKDKLVGGLYGVLFNGVFSGESMFHKKSEASKVCLVHTVEHLKSLGHRWMDIQMVTPLLEQFGGEYIPRKTFLNLLRVPGT